jgi:DNA-binding response OmpR family regulator
MPKILVVDDDPNIRELVCALLKNGGFEPFEACDGRDALTKMTAVAPELCVVDLMMPNMDGYELTRKIRQYYENMPVLMLTAKAELSAKAAGFGAGTDDYLTKPFEDDELLMRVRALLRRYKIEASNTVQVGGVTIDKNSYTIGGAGATGVKSIPMKEFELLYKLAGSPGRTFTRDSLIEDIWGYDFEGNERTLDVHIGRLRERFPAETSGFKITTVRGLGYRLEVVS